MIPTVAKRSVLPCSLLLALLVAACAPAPTPPAAEPAPPAAAPAAPAKPEPAAPPAEPAPAAPAAKPAATQPPAAKAPADDQAVADFYRGKTVRIVVGLSPGGGYDQFARMIARHMPKYIPGSPTMIVENRPGAASLLAANAVYNTEPRDGMIIGNFNENLVMQQVVGAPGIEFDAERWQWLGSLEKGRPACVVRSDAAGSSMEELMAGEALVIGTQGPGSYSHSVPSALNVALETDIHIVPGYGGTSDIRLAMESGEVDGGCWTWTAMRAAVQEWLGGDGPFARILLVMGRTVPDDPFLADTPAVETLAPNDEARQILAAVNAPTEMTKPYAVAPEVPAERVEALRTAFDQTLSDPQFLAEAEQANLAPGPSTAAEVEQTVAELMALPPDVLEKVKQITQ